jgi:hypothetical protein
MYKNKSEVCLKYYLKWSWKSNAKEIDIFVAKERNRYICSKGKKLGESIKKSV